MKTGKAIKLPIPVEYILLENTQQSILAVYRFIHGKNSVRLNYHMAEDFWEKYSEKVQQQGYLPIKTLESGVGTQNADFGDYILKGISGECYPCKPKEFGKTYRLLQKNIDPTTVVDRNFKWEFQDTNGNWHETSDYTYDTQVYESFRNLMLSMGFLDTRLTFTSK